MVGLISQLYFSNHRSSSYDPAFTAWKTVLSMNITQNTSIITACIPCLKPLLESLETGMMRSNDFQHRQRHYRHLDGNYNSYKLSDTSSNRKSGAPPLHGQKDIDSQAPPSTGSAVKVSSHTPEWEDEQQGYPIHAIKATRTWTVDITEGPSHHTAIQ